MKIRNIHKIRLKRVPLLLIILLMILFPTFLTNIFNLTNISKSPREDARKNNDFDILNNVKLSVLGNDTWWDYSFQYRRLIQITNPYNLNFTNYGVGVSINYTQMRQENQIYQDDLDDIRVVEHGILRNYYVAKDFPETGFATIYFDTDISQLATETDTYIYFGNDIVESAEAINPSDSFGWIKNGDFELDVSTATKFEPYGWNFSHNPVQEIMGKSNPSPDADSPSVGSYNFFVNKLTTAPSDPDSAERLASGTYAYKWGAQDDILPDGTVHDYAGTFFSYPFTVPIIGGGDIFLKAYRNARTWRFERPKNLGQINDDGYFIRVLNGSDSKYNIDPDLHSDDDIFGSNFQHYAEALDGNAYWNNPARQWKDDSTLMDLSTHSIINDTYSNIIMGIPDDTYNPDGDFTGYVYINLTDYMGKKLFFEIGVWGDEYDVVNQEKSAFFQVDDVGFNYTLTTSIFQAQSHESSITVITRDVDGRIVPNAEVAVVNSTIAKGMPGYVVTSGLTDSNGRATFNMVPNGYYNISVNYTLNSQEIEVFNSYDSGTGPYYYNGISYTKEAELELWTIDFEIVDWDNIPLNLGYIEINESLGGNLIDILTLNSNGKATFRWQNVPSYYFSVYYDNDDYVGSPILLNESYIYRSDYAKSGTKFRSQSLWVNNTNTKLSGANSYSISEYLYTNGSSFEFGNKKIIKFNVSLSNMVNQLTNVSIYYIDKDNTTGSGNENLIYFEDGYSPGEENDYIELDIPYIINSKLESENFEVYGLQILVNGINFTQCDGIINVKTVETCNVYNRTDLARLNIRVIKKESGIDVPYPALIKISDNSTGQPLVNLTSHLDRDGFAYTTITDLPFWFLKDRTYNISINSLNITNVDFNVTYLSPVNQWYPASSDGINSYNYTLYGGSSITFNLIFKVEVNLTNYVTAFFNASGTEEAFWGEDFTFSVNFYLTEDDGQTWNPITNPSASCTLYVRNVGSEINLITIEMGSGVGNGNFTETFNSNVLSAGGTFKYYTVKIRGTYPGYPDPNDESFLIKVKSIPTGISAHDYDTLTTLPDQSYTAYYDEIINITVKYSIEASGNPLDNSILSYTWIGQTPVNFYSDPQNTGFYTFTLNTADALTTGLKIITIAASLENYTNQENFLIYLTILQRQTTLNGETDLVYMSPWIWVQDTHYFTFSYDDANTLNVLGDLTINSFSWYELDEFGDRILGNQGTGILIQNLNKTYYLDFDTELRHVGFYFLHITLQKENFVPRFAYISLEIRLREFEAIWDSTGKGTNNQVRVVQGKDIAFEIDLNDESRGNINLENAQVTLNIGGQDYSFVELSPAVYTYTFRTSNVDAFLTSKTFVGTITIEKANFTSEEIRVTIIVGMEEIFPGIPTFYFILITASVIGVVGSIIGYRVIQQARIPKHVKKIRKIKGAIKSKKKISESITIPSKAEMIAKLFGDDWKGLGLSINEALGIKELKSKKVPQKGKMKEDKLKDGGKIE